MDTAKHFRTIWSHRWVVLLVAVVAAAATVFVWRTNEPPSFEVETRLEVTANGGDARARPTGDDAVFIAQGYAERAQSSPLLEAAATRSGLALTRDDVEDRVEVTADSRSGSITVTATGPSGIDAALLSDAVAATLVDAVASEQQQRVDGVRRPLTEEIAQLELTLGALPADDPGRAALEARHQALVSAVVAEGLRPADAVAVVSPADPATDPVSPRPRRDALLAFLLGLIITAELVAAASMFGDRFSMKNLRADVTTTSGLPVLSIVPRGSPAAEREAFRELRTHLDLMTPARNVPSTVAVLGAHAGVGCTHTAVELARVATAGSRPVLLIDADLRRPAVHEQLGLPLSPGLAELLNGRELVPGAPIAAGAEPVLHALTAGEPVDDPVSALSQNFGQRIIAASRGFALTLVDTPPITALADGGAIAVQCDIAILVIDARSTSRQALRDVLFRLRQVGVVPLGIVVEGGPKLSGRRRGRARPSPSPTVAQFTAVDTSRPMRLPSPVLNGRGHDGALPTERPAHP